MQSRRKFLKNTSLAAAATLFAGKSSAKEAKEKIETPTTEGNIVLSTWRFGVGANQRALEVLKSFSGELGISGRKGGPKKPIPGLPERAEAKEHQGSSDAYKGYSESYPSR